MSEHLKHQSHEKFEITTPEHLALPTAEQAEPLRQGEQDPAQALIEARTLAQETAQSKTQLNPIERLQAAEKASEAPSHNEINQELRSISLNRELRQIQRKLPATQRAFSRIANQPLVNSISEPLGATFNRPSGLLGGGLLAFLGTSSYLYIAKHQGFAYNYFIFLLLFVGGFMVGLTLELLIHTLVKRRQLS
jgi:hypothetical protein